MDKIPERPLTTIREMLDQLDLVDDELRLSIGMVKRLIPKPPANVGRHLNGARLRLVWAINQLREAAGEEN